MSVEKINVWRAIRGSGSVEEKRGELPSYTYTGVTKQQLRETGICTSNKSDAQEGKAPALGGFESRSVGGVPVFLDYERAVRWLDVRLAPRSKLRTYLVLAHLALEPAQIHVGRPGGLVKVFTNPGTNEQDDGWLGPEDLLAHQRGERPIYSECYMPFFPAENEEIRAACTFYTPRVIRQRRPDLTVESPFIQLDLTTPD